MNSRRLLQQAFGLTFIVLLLVGCGGAPAEPDAKPTPIPQTSTPPPSPATEPPTPSATHTHTPLPPTITPSLVPPTPIGDIGGQIAFISDRDGNPEIYVMNADGSEQINLTNHKSEDRWPTMSPDGEKIAFISNRNDPEPATLEETRNWEIYVVNINGTGLTRLTDDPGWDSWPAWSPDGSQIAFWSARDEQWDVFVMNNDGSNPTNLTSDVGMDLYPTWMPNGYKVVFFSTRDNGFQFWTVDTDGTGLTMLESGLPPSEESKTMTTMITEDYNFYALKGSPLDMLKVQDSRDSLGEFPAWSPDGTKVAFHSKRDGNREIYVMNSDLTTRKRLTNNESEDSFPVWSPDGLYIVFQSNRDSNFEIYIMNADGSNLRNLTNNPADDTIPAWYP